MEGREPADVIEGLREGNARFCAHVRANPSHYAELAAGQSPRAAVLACADSRVAPEIVFDVGLGEIFVVRVAGNVANTATLASLEFAVSQLGVRLIIVMAHQSCGAVQAALAGGDAGRNLNRLVGYIEPAVEEVGVADIDEVARRNARVSAERLTAESPILHASVENEGLRIVTAFHRFTTGAVEFD